MIILAVILTACGSSPNNANVAIPKAPASSVAPAPVGAPGPAPAATTSGVAVERVVAYDTRMDLVVQDPVATADTVTKLTTTLGGYLASSDRHDQDDGTVVTLSLRVPSKSRADLVDRLRGMALKVNAETTSSQDVTQQYVDLDARERTLEATQNQYLDLMKKATTVSDVVQVQQRLTDVQSQIEQLKGQIQLLQNRTDYSTIDVTLNPPTLGFRPFRYVRSAWDSSFRIIEVVIGGVILFWWLIIPIGAFFGYRRYQRYRRRPIQPSTPPAG